MSCDGIDINSDIQAVVLVLILTVVHSQLCWFSYEKWYTVSCDGIDINSDILSVVLVLILTVVHSHLCCFSY